MKLSKNKIKKILSDEVLIYAYCKQLWKNGITPVFKLSDEVMEFVEFLKKHNAFEDFVKYFNNYHFELVENGDDVFYIKSNITLKEYFKDMPTKFFLKGAFEWKMNNRYHIWNGLNEMWNEQIKNR